MLLTERLRWATRAAHQRVERAGWLQRLLGGSLAPDEYHHQLVSLVPLYAALEGGLRIHHRHPALSVFDWASVTREPQLLTDEAFWRPMGPEHGPAKPVPAAALLAARLARLVTEAPHLLLAHAYVRYLGDLHGGQILARSVARMAVRCRQAAGEGTGALHAGEGAPHGAAFYCFGSPASVQLKIAALRAALDTAPLGPEQTVALVDEAVDAFARHEEMFMQLDAEWTARA